VPAFKDSLTDAEEKLGAEIVMKALRAPARIIAENAGRVLGGEGETGGRALVGWGVEGMLGDCGASLKFETAV
jgi:hypothetical protein